MRRRSHSTPLSNTIPDTIRSACCAAGGELTGLQWADLDFESGFIEVRRTLHDGGRVELPKNGKIRRVDMSRQLAAELLRLLADRSQEALRKGWGQVPDWVFWNEEGRPIWISNFELRVFHGRSSRRDCGVCASTT